MSSFDRFFSADTGSFFRSPTREIFKKVDLNSIYSLSGGYPSADTFPLEDIRRIQGEVIDTYGAAAFQYGGTQGLMQLREVIAARSGQPVERIQITTSSQQGIDVCTRVLIDPGDVIITSNPTYLGALQSFRSYRADVRGVKYCDDLGEFEKSWRTAISDALAEGRRVKFIYVIPDFQNPSGESLDSPRRAVIASLAEEFDLLIVEDSPYTELRYDGVPLKSISELSPDRTLRLGSFSKIFAPGFRLGWINGHPDLLDQIYVCKQSLDLCPPVFDQYVAALYMGSGCLDANLRKSIALYRRKRDIMLSSLEENMPEGLSWTRPEGGLFVFLTLPEGFDSVAFYPTALDAGVAYVAGNFFHTDGTGFNTMRLNFSFLTEERLAEGVALLGSLLKKYFKENGL